MKIRLQIVGPAGEALMFEHAGPVIHVGRDPECELALSGANSDGVSRKHLRIELAASVATLSDLGSLNGTYVNDAPAQAPVSLRVGDRIQPGVKGPVLTVVQLDLTSGAPARAWQTWQLAAAGGLAAVLLVGVGLLLLPNRDKLPEVAKAPPGEDDERRERREHDKNQPGQEEQERERRDREQREKELHAKEARDKTERERKEREKQQLAKGVPSARIAEIGQYLGKSEQMPLSVLLQRLNEQHLWALLRDGDAVSSGHTLISLPGYRSGVLLHPKYQSGKPLKEGVGLILAGNLPELAPWPPLSESVVTLHYPPADAQGTFTHDADFTLERGRVWIGNAKPRGAAKVRVRFLQEVWDITLLDGKTRVAAELWYHPEEGTNFWLVTEGSAEVQELGQAVLKLPPKALVGWRSTATAPAAPTAVKELPDWWTQTYDLKSASSDPKAARVRDALQCLKDWQDSFAQAGDVTNFIADRVVNISLKDLDTTHRAHGMRFLAALDRVNKLLEIQDRPEIPWRVRGGAVFALRQWLAQGPNRIEELEQMVMYQYRNKPTVEVVVNLLAKWGPKELTTPEARTRLFDWLDHDLFIVRQLAFAHLNELQPEPGKGGYDPGDSDKTARAEKIKKWRDTVQGK